MLSDNERRRFDDIAGELGQDDKIARLDKKTGRKQPPARAPRARQRSLTEWAEQRFEQRMRRDR